jgi:pimeloyl-ACP methyl ester carboxylesterase
MYQQPLRLLFFCFFVAATTTFVRHGAAAMKLHSVTNNNPPTADGTTACPVLFLHGLDSSSQTWKEILPNVNAPCVAIDLRGCGDSPAVLQDDDFSMDILVQDVFDTVKDHPYLKEKKFILYGHSMGGRIAMAYAASYPSQIATLIVEDMDIAPRVTQPFQLTYDPPFERQFSSAELATKVFEDMGYPSNRVNKLIQEGRIAQRDDKDNQWWSHVNPDFRRLCYKQIMALPRAQSDWKQIAKDQLPTYLLVAGADQTVCLEDSLEEMQGVYPQVQMRRYQTATHSIHNSDREEFLALLNTIVKE